MKKLAALILLTSLTPALAADVQLQISRHNQSVSVPDAPAFITNIIAFVQSASVGYRNSNNASNHWQDVLASGSFIHLTCATPQTFQLPVMVDNLQKWEDRAINEILISLPEGRYPEIQFRSDTNYLTVGKYDPRALQRLIMEPTLDLSTTIPYDTIYNAK